MISLLFDGESGQRAISRPFNDIAAGGKYTTVTGANEAFGSRVQGAAQMGATRAQGVNFFSLFDYDNLFFPENQRTFTGNIRFLDMQQQLLPLLPGDKIFSQKRQGYCSQNQGLDE